MQIYTFSTFLKNLGKGKKKCLNPIKYFIKLKKTEEFQYQLKLIYQQRILTIRIFIFYLSLLISVRRIELCS